MPDAAGDATKKELFPLVLAEAFDGMTSGMAATAGDLRGARALGVMGEAYRRLRADRSRLLLQMQRLASRDDPEVRETVQAAFGTLRSTVADISGLDPARVKVFIANGMLLNDVAAMDVADLDAEWAKACLAPTPTDLLV